MLAHIARLGGIGGKILNELVVHPDPIVRRGVAKRLGSGGFFHITKTNKYLVDLLVQDSDDEVRVEMYDDRRLDRNQQLALFRDKSPVVRDKILRLFMGWLLNNRNCDSFRTYSYLYDFYQEAIVELASDPCKDVRWALAYSREAPPTAT